MNEQVLLRFEFQTIKMKMKTKIKKENCQQRPRQPGSQAKERDICVEYL